MKNWIRKQKLRLMLKWAESFGLFVVQIRTVAGTEYLVDKDGTWRKLAGKKAKKIG